MGCRHRGGGGGRGGGRWRLCWRWRQRRGGAVDADAAAAGQPRRGGAVQRQAAGTAASRKGGGGGGSGGSGHGGGSGRRGCGRGGGVVTPAGYPVAGAKGGSDGFADGVASVQRLRQPLRGRGAPSLQRCGQRCWGGGHSYARKRLMARRWSFYVRCEVAADRRALGKHHPCTRSPVASPTAPPPASPPATYAHAQTPFTAVAAPQDECTHAHCPQSRKCFGRERRLHPPHLVDVHNTATSPPVACPPTSHMPTAPPHTTSSSNTRSTLPANARPTSPLRTARTPPMATGNANASPGTPCTSRSAARHPPCTAV